MWCTLFCSQQKRDNSSSASDQSSVVKSNSTPSTPQGGGGSNLHGESRLSEGSPLMEQFSEPKEDREGLEDTSHEMETPEVRKNLFFTSFIYYSTPCSPVL